MVLLLPPTEIRAQIKPFPATNLKNYYVEKASKVLGLSSPETPSKGVIESHELFPLQRPRGNLHDPDYLPPESDESEDDLPPDIDEAEDQEDIVRDVEPHAQAEALDNEADNDGKSYT